MSETRFDTDARADARNAVNTEIEALTDEVQTLASHQLRFDEAPYAAPEEYEMRLDVAALEPALMAAFAERGWRLAQVRGEENVYRVITKGDVHPAVY